MAATDLAGGTPVGAPGPALGDPGLRRGDPAHHDGARPCASRPPIAAAVVGEPTNLEIAVAQRGLMMVDLVARGDQRHAGYAADGAFENAITRLAADLIKLPDAAPGASSSGARAWPP